MLDILATQWIVDIRVQCLLLLIICEHFRDLLITEETFAFGCLSYKIKYI